MTGQLGIKMYIYDEEYIKHPICIYTCAVVCSLEDEDKLEQYYK